MLIVCDKIYLTERFLPFFSQIFCSSVLVRLLIVYG